MTGHFLQYINVIQVLRKITITEFATERHLLSNQQHKGHYYHESTEK